MSPLEKGDHPELDTSELLNANGTQKYQSMIRAMQWAISIGCFDIATAAMSLSSFCVAPHSGHLDQCKCIYGFLHKRHTMLSYHHVQEAIASGIVKFYYIPGEINPADILSKHWGHQQIWKQLQPLLFWQGDTRELFEKKHRKEAYGGP